MALYTSSQTIADGIVANAVLNTVTNTITYTITGPNGFSATSVQDTNQPGLRSLSTQLDKAPAIIGDSWVNAINSVYLNVKKQANDAAAVAEKTGEPPPQESQPTPVNSNSDPQQEAFLEANLEPAVVAPAEIDFDAETETQLEVDFDYEEPPEVDPDQDPGTDFDSETETQLEVDFDYEEPPEVDPDQDPGTDFGEEETQIPESEDPSSQGSARGLVGNRKKTRAQATAQDNSNYKLLGDWRVTLSLAPGAKYLYNADPPGILAPLANTDGVVFPYTPTVTVNYTANYDPTELVHSNYKIFQYRSSAVDSISIVGDFTAQDVFEANYLLAVIHFFRSITKMFYGQDNNPINGTPPPLCYLRGYGAFGFDYHPLLITSFTSTFPNDVDYIRATTHDTVAGVNTSDQNISSSDSNTQNDRLSAAGLSAGAKPKKPNWGNPETTSNNTGGTVEPTYVPTKMQIQVSAVPIVSRNDISRRFSLRDYATGKLLRGSKSPARGGIW